MSKGPYITVVIPLYNKEDYIVRAVTSVLAQGYACFEVVVVDDGSSDASAERLAKIQDSRLKYVYQENQGEGAARNAGLRHASHDWVAFLDADDSWESGFLEAIVDLIHRYPSARLAATGYSISDGVACVPIKQRVRPCPQQIGNYFGLSYQDQLPFCASSVAIRREALLTLGGFPEVEEMGADQGMWCRLLLNDWFAFNPAALATYHQDANGRVCKQNVPSCELPFSKRLQRQIDSQLVCLDQLADARRYIAAHLLHLAKLNLYVGNWQAAITLLADRRARRLPIKWLIRAAQLCLARTQSLFSQTPDRALR